MVTNNNVTGSYCLSKKPHVSHHIIFITVYAQNVRLQHECKRVDAAPLAYSTFNPCDSQRSTHCWCVVSVRRRPRFWYDRRTCTCSWLMLKK